MIHEFAVIKYLEQYVRRTAELRGSERQLLISYKVPHKAVGSQTLSRSLRSLLIKPGISDYTGHSTRSASTSEAANALVPMELILAAADWYSATVFNKHYHKKTQNTYANVVLSTVSFRSC